MKRVLLIFLWTMILCGSLFGQEVTSVTLNWTAPGDDGNVGTAYQYDVRYSLNPITEQNWNDCIEATGEPVPQEAGSPETFTVEGLEANTTYHFAVKTSDEAGNWSGLSNVATVTTTDNVPPAAIIDLTATSDE
ncbi:MAG TPA: hypothetical protein ENO22_05600 [candidate division Zixibacteria bacterium]|nr:hypothetical protein [candidate division Zixibacteria bacterium]